MGIAIQTPNAPQLKIIRWISPPWPSFKLNSDGACKQNGISGGGGVIRNFKGDIILAYSHYYGHTNSLIAEARAILDGTKYLHTITDRPAYIECDSHIIVRIINKETQCPWSILSFVREIWKLISQHDRIIHTYREGNKVADLLASLACNSKCNAFYSCNELPTIIKGEARLDKLGLPSIRVM